MASLEGDGKFFIYFLVCLLLTCLGLLLRAPRSHSENLGASDEILRPARAVDLERLSVKLLLLERLSVFDFL